MSNYRKISEKIQEVVFDNPKNHQKKLTWVNVNKAEGEEIKYLRRRYNFDLEHLRFSCGQFHAQRSLFKKNGHYLFIILHFPTLIGESIESEEVEIFFGRDYLVTVHNNIQEIDAMFNLAKKDQKMIQAYKTESPRVLLAEILERLFTASFVLLDKISIDINKVEEIIFKQEHVGVISEILIIRHNIINFRKVMQNYSEIIREVMDLKTNNILVNKKVVDMYGDLLNYSKRIWTLIENRKETIEALNSTNESLANFRLNNIMKTLTMFSVVMFPLTLLAAVFGMNTTEGMPFISDSMGFWRIIALMLGGSFLMLVYFKYKKWM